MSPFFFKEDCLRRLSARETGLSTAEAAQRLLEWGPNIFGKKKRFEFLTEILHNFINPLNCVLGIICAVSFLVGEKINALIVSVMIGFSSALSFIQEHRSIREAKKLSQTLRSKTAVLRDGTEQEIDVSRIVPGDVVILRAGDLVPADLRILQSKDLFLNEASLTGESLPVEKHAMDKAAAEESVAYAGSSVVSGTGAAVVTTTGNRTQFGELVEKLSEAPVETAFDKGINRFVWLMIRFTGILVLLIFAVNVLVKGKAVEALLFSLAVAVGLTPEMLPVIVAITLSAGAISLSRKKVLVKHLNAIQNLGAMDVLCSDKTGTLTENRIVLEKHCDVLGKENAEVLRLAYLNSFNQTGLKNLLDDAILNHQSIDLHAYHKIDEIPFDFDRRLMSVVVEMGNHHRLITKGAAEAVFQRSTRYELEGVLHELTPPVLADLSKAYESLSVSGFRVLAVAYKDFKEKKSAYSKEDEEDMVLKGYLAFLDPPKTDAREIINRIEHLGVRLLVLTGDDELITKNICHAVGLNIGRIITGKNLESLSDDQILALIQNAAVFARLSPMQKEKIVQLLRRNGHTVGYLGDGINDAPSLKGADIGISVEGAVDVAREAADLILLEKSLLVIESGILEGRKISCNVMKYLKMGASSNLGNMMSMTAASFFLPYLPMTAVQILLNNLLYDFSQFAIPTDTVDADYILKPRPWSFVALKRFMLIFGSLSSVFDFVTFGVMLYALKFSEERFHTGWFLESLATQTLVIHIVRSGKIPFLQTRASTAVIITSILTLMIGFGVTALSVNTHLGFEKMPAPYYAILLLIVAAYLLIVEISKRIYASKYAYD